MTEYPIRGGDVVKIKLKSDRVGANGNALWMIQVDRTTMEPSGLDTSFIISAFNYTEVLERLLPILGKDHDDYANSEWTIEEIGIDTREDQSSPYVMSVGSW